MKLISMTDFVILMRSNKEKDNIRRFWACEKYAKFLKQSLILDMFIGENALFDGFEIIHKDKCRITIQSDFLQIDYNVYNNNFNDLKNIECLSLFFTDLTLTPYAIKQLGL